MINVSFFPLYLGISHVLNSFARSINSDGGKERSSSWQTVKQDEQVSKLQF